MTSFAYMLENAQNWYLVSIPSLTIISLITLIIGLKLWYQMYRVSKQVSISAGYRFAIIVCTVSSILCLLTDLTHIYRCFITSTFIFKIWPDRIHTIADVWYYIGTNSFYIIAFLRLHLTFKDTQHGLNTKSAWLIIILLCISIFTASYYTIAAAIIPFDTFLHKYGGEESTIILMINDCILNTTLMLLFVSRLQRAIIENETNTKMEWSNDQYGKQQRRISKFRLSFTQFSRLNKDIIDVITLHTNLFGLAIFTNQLFLISVLLGFWYKSIQFYIFLFRGFECSANVIVLYLSFPANRILYSKYCKYCHGEIKQFCINRTTKRVRNDIYHRLHPSMNLSVTKPNQDDNQDNDENNDTYIAPMPIEKAQSNSQISCSIQDI